MIIGRLIIEITYDEFSPTINCVTAKIIDSTDNKIINSTYEEIFLGFIGAIF